MLGADRALSAGNSTAFAQQIAEVGFQSPDGQRATDLLSDGLQRLREPNVILSTEYMWSWRTNDLASLRKALERAGFDVTAVTYLREQREWLISRYAQAVKRHRWTIGLEEFLQAKYKTTGLNFSRQFERLYRIFDPGKVVVRLFERESLTERDVRKDLLAALGIDCRDFVLASDRSNASANVVELEMLRIFNKYPPQKHFNSIPFLDFAWNHWREQGEEEPPRELYRYVSPALMRRFGAYYSRENEAFRAAYLPDRPAPLFHSAIPEDYEQFSAADRISEKSIRLMQCYAIHLLARAERKTTRRSA